MIHVTGACFIINEWNLSQPLLLSFKVVNLTMHADRMFFDLSGTWKSVLEEMSDVNGKFSRTTIISN